MKKRIRDHLERQTLLQGGQEHATMKKNPMDMAAVMFNLSLQFDKSAVAYAKREKVTSLKAFRALIMDKSPQMVTAMWTACKQDDARVLRRAIDECIRSLAQEYFEFPLEISVITALHFLTETSAVEFQGKRRATQLLVREALAAPKGQLDQIYQKAKADGWPPLEYQTAMVEAHSNLWLRGDGDRGQTKGLTWDEGWRGGAQLGAGEGEEFKGEKRL